MFLIRTAFWLSLVILLIPTGESDSVMSGTGDSASNVSAFEAISAAQTTVSDLAGFCGRNPETCETGSAAFKLFGKKAAHGAQMVYEYIAEAGAEGLSPSEALSAQDSIDTLLQEDRDIPWQGPGTQG